MYYSCNMGAKEEYKIINHTINTYENELRDYKVVSIDSVQGLELVISKNFISKEETIELLTQYLPLPIIEKTKYEPFIDTVKINHNNVVFINGNNIAKLDFQFISFSYPILYNKKGYIVFSVYRIGSAYKTLLILEKDKNNNWKVIEKTNI